MSESQAPQQRSPKMEELKRDGKLNADFKSLAEQLQNERATVSRAVAQNMDLKEQLGELQDRLVEVTNRCAEQEDERQRAVAMVKNLSRRLEEMDSNGSQSMNEVQKQAYDLPIVPELLEKHIESMGYLSEDYNRQLIDISKAIKRIIKKYHPHTAAEELDQLTELPDIIVNRLPSHHHQHNGTVPPPPTPKNDASTMVDQDLAKNLPSPAVLETALQTAAKEALETEEMEVNNEQHEKTVDKKMKIKLLMRIPNQKAVNTLRIRIIMEPLKVPEMSKPFQIPPTPSRIPAASTETNILYLTIHRCHSQYNKMTYLYVIIIFLKWRQRIVQDNR
ncbi:unnamed protein product [Bursaphelenchus xylophilus]|uniref:(pine wood nematode) hypothetical protein n=1 Tax=Bursaphelenchus xylophilus TaxID=6326 RepID=A0A811KCJ6_BURXY|nr:unnamed protein product [Bursaphelenchus xylophilus]CAG9091986.1 unnamed protein product [Bursaphelenchus xylophilus]